MNRREAAEKLAAKKDYAPGIPRKGKISKIPTLKKKEWALGIQKHDAYKAGPHYDFRLGNPSTGVGHSWVFHKLPKPGESVKGIQTNDHRIGYFGFEGEIPRGVYGGGKVTRHTLGKADVVESNPGKINFNEYLGRDTNEYTLVQAGKSKGKKLWRLINRTPTKQKEGKQLPESKPKYKEIKPEQVDPGQPGRWDAKIDGAHLVYRMKSGKPIQAFSHRESRASEKLIQHTHRIPSLSGKRAPKSIKGETILRGEVYAKDPATGKAVPARTLGALLNSSVPKSRDLQKAHGKLRNAIFDIVKHQGRDVSKLDPEEKRALIHQIIKQKGLKGVFEVPPSATTPEAKAKLFKAIKEGKVPETKEGIIIHRPEGGMTKVKFKPEFDVKIKGVFPSKKSGEAGGFVYEEVDGKKVAPARVGTGFSRLLKQRMQESPEEFKGLVAKVHGLEQHPSGKIRAPSFHVWHQDKNDPNRIPEIQK